MAGRRVVVTGIGAVTPLGNDVKSTWAKLIEGQSGVGKITRFDASDMGSQIAAEVKDFDPTKYISPKEVKRFDRFSQFAYAAAQEAWESSGLTESHYEPARMGSIVGVGIGGLETLEDNFRELLAGGPRKVSPFLIPAMISNLAPGHIAIKYNLQGVNYVVTSACTSGTHAIGEAFRMIREGRQDMVCTGGAEAAITTLGVSGFARMKALSTRNDDPTHASRPFDRDRDGFVIGEGAGMLILEELEGAKKRGAKILGEVIGYGFSCDAFHITAPPEDGSGAIKCMKDALRDAQVNPEQVGYINAHGTSTPINDPAETAAVKNVFGGHAKNLMMSSTKSMTGHLLGAAGGVEGVFSTLTLSTGVVPPTANLENPDERCDLDYVPKSAREKQVDHVMSNSFGFGGTNASIVLKRFSA